MFFITFALLGLFLANNLNKAPRLYSVDTPVEILSSSAGQRHAHYELHHRVHKDLVLRDPRFWRASKTYKDIVAEANGPKEKRTPFNLVKSRQSNLGDITPVLAPRGKHL